MRGDYTYEQWGELLAGFFFDEAHDGEEILFAVDELSLSEASGLTDASAADSLASAVLALIGRGWNVGVVNRRVKSWRASQGEESHPALPFLALTVLAASRMGGYEGFAPHKFYVPLRRALDPDDTETNAPGTYLQYIRGLWADLAQWANHDRGGQYGRLTIRNPGVQYGRGLAFQHALVKSYDLQQLDAFFRRIGLEPGEEVSAPELRRSLAVWTATRPEPWAHRLHRVSSDQDLREYAEALLAREASRWDGRPRDPRTGRAIGCIRLGFRSARRPQVGLFIQWDERLPQHVDLTLPSGKGISLDRDHGWFTPHPVDDLDVVEAMSSGLTLSADGHRFAFRAEEAYALSYDDDLGSWVSVDSMSFGDRYHLLVREEFLGDVLRFLTAESSTGSRVAEDPGRLLLQGWRLISDVRIDGRPKSAAPACLSALVPSGAGPRLRLLGGLPLPSGRSAYLRGGEPALALSTLSNDTFIEIHQASSGKTERFRVATAANNEVPLWQLQLDPDVYQITHGESTVRLQIVDGIAEAAGPGAGTVQVRALGEVRVVGTQTNPVVVHPQPITVPAPAPTQTVILLGARPGEHLGVECPLWMAQFVGFELSWRHIDAWPSFETAWILMRGETGRYEAILHAPLEPDSAPDSRESLWGRAIAISSVCAWETEEAKELWSRYRQAAEAGS